MKILCVLNSLGSGGAERQMSYLCSLLANDGHDVTLCYYAKNNFNISFVSEKVRLEYIPKKSRMYLCKTMAKLMCERDADVVISYLMTPSFYTSIAKALAMRPQTKLIVSERNFNINGFSLKDYALRLIPFFLADKVVCNAQAQQRLIQRKLPFWRRKIVYIGNALNLSLYPPKKNFNNTGMFKLVFPASFLPSKNHLNLAKALLLLKDRGTLNLEIHCYGRNIGKIVGEKQYITPCYMDLVNFIKQNNLSSNMVLHDAIPDLYKHYIEYDGLILPSFYEGCPNAVMEGMASALPVVAADVSDVAFLTEERRGGILFNPHSIEDIAESLSAFCGLTHDERLAMSVHNRHRAEELFDFQTFLRKHYDIMGYKYE